MIYLVNHIRTFFIRWDVYLLGIFFISSIFCNCFKLAFAASLPMWAACVKAAMD